MSRRISIIHRKFFSIVYFLLPVHIMGSTLVSVPLPFRCFTSTEAPLQGTSNLTSISTTNQPLTPIYDSRCGAIEQNVSLPPPLLLRETGLPSCPLVDYDYSTFPSTIISEFHLVCERSFLRPVFQTMVSFGVLFGALLGGVISDKYGRRRTIVIGSVASTVMVVVMVVCPWYPGIILSRFAMGISGSFMLLPSCSLTQETTPPRFRSYTGMLTGLGFSVGIVFLAGLGYLIRPWRYLLLAASPTLLIIILLAWCMVEESPRWLAQEGRHKEVDDALERAARRNRVAVTPEFVVVLEKLRTESRKRDAAEEYDRKAPLSSSVGQCLGQCRDYLRYPGLRVILLVTPILWYVQSLLYLGIMLNANNFTSNDPFVYVAMSGVMDFTAIVLSTPITMRVGRRTLFGLLLFCSGALLLLDLAVPAELQWLKWLLVMGAFLMCSASYQVLFIYTPELFPTVIRSRGFGFSNSIGSLGLLTAPFITDLLVQKVWWAVNVVCGLTGLLGSLLLPLLPETRNQPLPETVQDVERRRLGSLKRIDSERSEERTTHETDTSHRTTPLLDKESENSNLEMKENRV